MADKKHILIVDDTPANIKILNDILKSEYKLSAATSGEKALKIAMGDTQPDVILLDVVMPEMDGFEVCKKLKDNDKTKNIPVIFISGHEDKGKQLGGAGFLKKPVEPEELKKLLKNL